MLEFKYGIQLFIESKNLDEDMDKQSRYLKG